jgi:hypothetical protein
MNLLHSRLEFERGFYNESESNSVLRLLFLEMKLQSLFGSEPIGKMFVCTATFYRYWCVEKTRSGCLGIVMIHQLLFQSILRRLYGDNNDALTW